MWSLICLLAVWNIASAVPAGENTCQGVIKHPVKVKVNVTEPVTFRAYTWCLRVPPRCSKYIVQMKERVKEQTELHNMTITVCCRGFVEMENRCVPACPPQVECPYMHCNRTNHCYCTPGYSGIFCNDPCPKGWWGKDCKKPCDCPPGFTCHHLTGDCMLDDKPSVSKTTVRRAFPQNVDSTVKSNAESYTPPATTVTSTASTPSTTPYPTVRLPKRFTTPPRAVDSLPSNVPTTLPTTPFVTRASTPAVTSATTTVATASILATTAATTAGITSYTTITPATASPTNSAATSASTSTVSTTPATRTTTPLSTTFTTTPTTSTQTPTSTTRATTTRTTTTSAPTTTTTPTYTTIPTTSTSSPTITTTTSISPPSTTPPTSTIPITPHPTPLSNSTTSNLFPKILYQPEISSTSKNILTESLPQHTSPEPQTFSHSTLTSTSLKDYTTESESSEFTSSNTPNPRVIPDSNPYLFSLDISTTPKFLPKRNFSQPLSENAKKFPPQFSRSTRLPEPITPPTFSFLDIASPEKNFTFNIPQVNRETLTFSPEPVTMFHKHFQPSSQNPFDVLKTSETTSPRRILKPVFSKTPNASGNLFVPLPNVPVFDGQTSTPLPIITAHTPRILRPVPSEESSEEKTKLGASEIVTTRTVLTSLLHIVEHPISNNFQEDNKIKTDFSTTLPTTLEYATEFVRNASLTFTSRENKTDPTDLDSSEESFNRSLDSPTEKPGVGLKLSDIVGTRKGGHFEESGMESSLFPVKPTLVTSSVASTITDSAEDNIKRTETPEIPKVIPFYFSSTQKSKTSTVTNNLEELSNFLPTIEPTSTESSNTLENEYSKHSPTTRFISLNEVRTPLPTNEDFLNLTFILNSINDFTSNIKGKGKDADRGNIYSGVYKGKLTEKPHVIIPTSSISSQSIVSATDLYQGSDQTDATTQVDNVWMKEKTEETVFMAEKDFKEFGVTAEAGGSEYIGSVAEVDKMTDSNSVEIEKSGIDTGENFSEGSDKDRHVLTKTVEITKKPFRRKESAERSYNMSEPLASRSREGEPIPWVTGLLVTTCCTLLTGALALSVTYLLVHCRRRRQPVPMEPSIMAYQTTADPQALYAVPRPSISPDVFFCPTFTNVYAEQINRELRELSYDKIKEEPPEPLYAEISY